MIAKNHHSSHSASYSPSEVILKNSPLENDAIKKVTSSANVIETLNVSSHSAKKETQRIATSSASKKKEPTTNQQVTHQHPKKLSEIFPPTSEQTVNGYKYYSGMFRKVAINEDLGFGYKFSSESSKMCKLDLVLNELYRSEAFYNGIYANCATNEILTVKNDLYGTPNYGRKEYLAFFKCIPNALQCSEKENIPEEALEILTKAGFSMLDIQPQNFVKIPYKDEMHFIPIDGKTVKNKNKALSHSVGTAWFSKINFLKNRF